MEAQSIKKRDKILNRGPLTAVVEMDLASLKVDDIEEKMASKGNFFTFTIDQKQRPSDKIYKTIGSK